MTKTRNDLKLVKKTISRLFSFIIAAVFCGGMLMNNTAILAQNHTTVISHTEATPPACEYKCTFHDARNVYYIMADGTITAYDTAGQLSQVGRKTPPPQGRETEFQYMIKLADITYAVDVDGHIWQSKYPFKEIVGQTEKYPKQK